MNVTEALQAAIRDSGRTLQDIWTAGGPHKATLSRFLRGQRSLTTRVADQLCKTLGVEVRTVKVTAKVKARKASKAKGGAR
jgi:plasmid maintenance system antidote protein VapI